LIWYWREPSLASIKEMRLAPLDDRCVYGGTMIAAPPRSFQIQNLFDLPARIDELDWEPFRPGIKIHRLYGNQKEGPSAALLLYDSGATLPRHIHDGYEHILVLSNSQRDDNGEHAAGTLVINPPGTSHAVRVPKGSLVLAIWERPVVFTE
jgi:anti-sigma factor ChrR (cupin superfamily)